MVLSRALASQFNTYSMPCYVQKWKGLNSDRNIPCTRTFCMSGSQKNPDGLSNLQDSSESYLLSFITIPQMHPTWLMPPNHDKVEFMREAERTQPNTTIDFKAMAKQKQHV